MRAISVKYTLQNRPQWQHGLEHEQSSPGKTATVGTMDCNALHALNIARACKNKLAYFISYNIKILEN
jgi:hypothetical protein